MRLVGILNKKRDLHETCVLCVYLCIGIGILDNSKKHVVSQKLLLYRAKSINLYNSIVRSYVYCVCVCMKFASLDISCIL